MGAYIGRKAWLGTVLAGAVALVLQGCGGSDAELDDISCAVTTGTGNITVGSGLPGDPAAPEPSSGFNKGKQGLKTKSYMVVTANPQASKAGCNVLKAGGSAVDAAVAVQMGLLAVAVVASMQMG